jgi:putative Holliday junction resolvase
MAIVDLRKMKALLKPNERLLGLDIGAKTIGLALSDVSLKVATPMETITRTRFRKDAEAIVRIVDKQGIGGLVIGLPISMDGREGPRCQSVRQFAANLSSQLDLPMAFWDERLSTAAVERVLIAEADLSRKRRARVIDKMAAAYILQGALDVMRLP